MTQNELVARAFARRLRETIGDENMAIVVEQNELDPGLSCMSHSFCDANMVMAAAMEDVLGREVYTAIDVELGRCTESLMDEDFAMWNAAWGCAKAARFWMDA
jgi:hypothetical protein